MKNSVEKNKEFITHCIGLATSWGAKVTSKRLIIFESEVDLAMFISEICAKKDAEIARIAKCCEHMRDAKRKAETNCSDATNSLKFTRHKLAEAQAQIAMQAEKIELISAELDVGGIESAMKLCMEINSSTAETVAAFRAKETEPLRREVAVLRMYVKHTSACQKFDWDTSPCNCGLEELLKDTQATALAYEREVENRGMEKLRPFNWTKEMSDAWHQNLPDVRAAFDALIRAANKGEAK